MPDIIEFNLGPFKTNCWLVKENQNAILIDCGGNSETVLSYLYKNNLYLNAIYLTHGHIDHILGISGIQDKIDVPIYIHKKDYHCITEPKYNVSLEVFGKEIVPKIKNINLFDDDFEITFFNMKFHTLFTPGHTEGSVCFDTGEFLFSGDTLFSNSYGRCDLPGGSETEIMKSLKKLLQIKGNRKVLPGHGPVTSLNKERNYYNF